MAHSPSRRQALLIVLALSAVLCLPWLQRPFHTRGEPREALVAQAMLTTGNWISPPSYDGAVPSKPPFSHWLIALTSTLQGRVSEATSRLPSAIAFMLFSVAFFLFVARRESDDAALGASIILLGSSEWFRAASTCRVDTILATSMAGALMAFFTWWERGRRGIPVLALLLTGVSALTKGPVGIVLPIGIFSLFCWYKERFAWKAILPLAYRAVLLSLPVIAIVSVWYLLGYLERGDAFIDKVRYENVDRFTSSMADEPHKHSVFYLFGMSLVGLLPWTFVVAPRIFGPAFRQRFTKVELTRRWNNLSDTGQFSVIASVCIVLFFCVPASKRSVYLLPAYPFIAIVLERVLRDCSAAYERALSRVSQAVCIIAIVACVVGLGSMLWAIGGYSISAQALLESMTMFKLICAAILLILFLGPLRFGTIRVVQNPACRVGVAMIIAVGLVSFFIYDSVATQLSPKGWISSRQFRMNVAPDTRERYYSYGSEMYGVSFYLGKQFSRAGGPLPAGSVVFTEAGRVDEVTREVAPRVRALSRYMSGIERPSKAIVALEVLP